MMSTFSNPPGETQAHTVLIVEPDSYWRKVHSMDVSRDGTFEVLCAVRNKRQAVAFLSRLPVDFIVTNSMLPDGNPADIIRFAQKRNPDCLVLAASDCEDANIVMQTITSGANGYVLFSDKTTNLCSCLRVLQAGGSPVPPSPVQYCDPYKVGKISANRCPKNILLLLGNSTHCDFWPKAFRFLKSATFWLSQNQP
jgi:DNA-binding NarL/FixJ family response regulator